MFMGISHSTIEPIKRVYWTSHNTKEKHSSEKIYSLHQRGPPTWIAPPPIVLPAVNPHRNSSSAATAAINSPVSLTASQSLKLLNQIPLIHQRSWQLRCTQNQRRHESSPIRNWRRWWRYNSWPQWGNDQGGFEKLVVLWSILILFHSRDSPKVLQGFDTKWFRRWWGWARSEVPINDS